MKKTLLFVLALIVVAPVSTEAQETSLFDSEGEAVAYIDLSDDLTIYLWEGTPVAYLDEEDIYGFNGKHLGWYSRGSIVDHDGDAACVEKQRHPSPKYESYKSYKEYKPYKSYKEYAPYKPYETGRFSNLSCALFLAGGGK